MAFSPYSDIITKMQNELDSKESEIKLLRAVIANDETNIFDIQEETIRDLQNQLRKREDELSSARKQIRKRDILLQDEQRRTSELHDKYLEEKCRAIRLQEKLDNTKRPVIIQATPEEPEPQIKKRRRKKKTQFAKEFDEIRPSILERDGYKCTECGGNKNLHVHHIVHKSKGGTNNPDNLITLCKWCHAERHKDEPVYNLMTKEV